MGASAPVALEVPSVGISTSLVRLHVCADGALETPGDFGVGGWWTEGPKPGDVGPAILVGHVNSYTGPAAFYPREMSCPATLYRLLFIETLATGLIVVLVAGAALVLMLGQIQSAFEARRASEDRLRRFVADASHELRTPLTSSWSAPPRPQPSDGTNQRDDVPSVVDTD